MIMNSDGAMLRWFSTDRGFTHDENSTLIGPIGGTIREDGTFDEDVTWGPGRWSSSTTWILIQLSRTDLEENGITYYWADAENQRDGYEFEGLNLVTTPPQYSVADCREAKESGDELCSFEWAIIDLEKQMRTTDQLSVTFSINEGVNVELNRELLESSLLLIAMAIAITILLWFSLRRASDVVIVGAPNFLSRTTLRPFGPSVTLTASARWLTPASSFRRASSSNLSIFDMVPYFTTASTSRADRIKSSSPPLDISVPPYFA